MGHDDRRCRPDRRASRYRGAHLGHATKDRPQCTAARLVVLEIEFTDRPAGDRRFWLHLGPARIDLCRRDTGAPVDIWLAGATEPITRWWLGQLSWRQLLLQPEVTIHGDRALQRQMSRWFLRYAYTPQTLSA